uniref:Rhodanese domain-containing protein n=1 Tax=Globisporangium ultimum (strain ATCC 200006 / CBS 805.95 / DAOM BR144) TaxID=431595 RepID=K3WW53_GLOUD
MVSRSSMAPPLMALYPVHDAPKYAVVLYYKYVRLGETPAQVEQLVRDHEQLCARLALTGRVRIAMEGINGTLGGKAESVAQYIATMQQAPHFEGIDWKTSGSDVEPFPELQVRLVQEIVAMEIPDEQCDLAHGGTHLTPEEFHHEQQANARERIALIDVRNNYEYNIGHFEGALNPKTRRFGQFPEWVRAELPELQKKDKILMYCTGGIRCEKASAYLKHLGLEKVYQLQGGIHRYLEKYPDGGGLFQGKNFVFDQRVAMASEDPTITGKCERCDVPYDVVSGTRCKYCRMHILLCEACRANGEDESLLYCEEHAHLVTGDAAQLAQKAQQLQSELDEVQGKAKKGRRRSLRKQLDTVERRIQELQRLAICSDDAEGPQDAE